MAIEILLSLVELVRCTNSKEMCKSGMEGILGPQFELHVLSSQLPFVLEGIFQALNNATLSTSDAFEALNQFGIRLADRMKELTHLWAAPIYERLLSPDIVERELAVNCLQKMKLFLCPPTALLAKTVAESMQNDLLTCMERMIESESHKVPVVNAWAWFISLIGGHVLENRVLVNRMLKILERTFLDIDIDVRIASQAAWKSMVDILVPSSLENGVEQFLWENKPGLIMPDLVERNREPLVQLTSKRMKLLMTPLVGTMTVEKSEKAWSSCWKICVYILQKLGCFANRISVMQFILVPMFESVFKSGRNSWNMCVWDSCAGLFEEFLSINIKDTPQRQVLPIECPPIKWPQWRLCHLEFLLKIFESLWKSYAGDTACSGKRKLNLKVVLRIWKLVLKGLDMEGTDTAEPSSEHQAAVHLILRFVNSTCKKVALLFESTHDRVLVWSVWPLLEYLVLEFKALVLASSLYKLPLNQGNGNGAPVPLTVDCTATELVCNDLSFTEGSVCEEMVTPISYISMVWLKFVSSLKLHDRKKAEVFHVKIDDHWLLNVWRAFIEHRLGEQAKIDSGIPCCNKSEPTDLFASSLLLFPCLISSFSKVKQISDKTEVPVPFDALPSSEEILVFTGDFSKVCNITVCSSLLMKSDHCQQSVETSSVQDYHVNGTNLNSHECSALKDIHHEFATIYGSFVEGLIKETCAFLNIDATSGPCGLNGIDAAGTAGQPTKFMSTLSLASRFLILMYEVQKSNVENSSTIARVCEALVSLSISVHTQNDILLFIQILSMPLAKWLCACWDPENHSASNSMVLEQDKIASSKQMENFLSVCKIVMRPLDLDNCTTIIGFNSCGDASILALVSRFLDIAWDVQNDISKISIDSFSRVCESLICFSNYLKMQRDILAFMQVLSKPLIKWFSRSVYSEASNDMSHQMLLLEKIWHRILTSLQNCHPPISFDSCLLNQQAPLLTSAFQCPYKAIAEQTLLFWERTYGIKTSRLSYPSCLVPVLCELQHKVKITLPGFLHTYVSRRGLKHQTKKRVQEFCATQKETLCLDTVAGHSGQANVNMVTMVGKAEIRNGKIEADPASDCKTCDFDETKGKFRTKSERFRKCKCNATPPPVLNHKGRKTMGVQHNSDLVEKTAIKHVVAGENADQGNIGSSIKFSIPVENIQGTTRKGRRTRKHKPQMYKPFVITNRKFAKQGKHSGECDKHCEFIRGCDAGDHTLDSNEGVTMECVNEAKGNLTRSGRRRKSPQLKLLTSDLKTLGIRHLRTLRNAGGLRGGKDWRTTHEMTKMMPKRARRQSQHFSISGRTDTKSTIETDMNMQVSGSNSLYMGMLGRALQKQKLEKQLCRCKRLSSVRRSQVDASEKACETSRQSVSESPFKVRALGGGAWSEGIVFSKPLKDSEETVPFTCNVNISPSNENKPECRSRNNRRKSCTPKRAPSNLVGEEMTNMHIQSTSFSQFTISGDEQAIVTGKRLKDVGMQLFTQQGWGNAKHATLKRLKTGKEKCILKKEDANIKLENRVDPCHAEHVCDGNANVWTGTKLQRPAFCHHVQSGRQSNLEQGYWQQEGALFGMGDEYSPKDNSKDLEARNEVSSKTQSEATDQEMETKGLEVRQDQLHEGISQLNNRDSQSTEEKQLPRRQTQPCDVNGSSGTSTEVCTEPSIVNHTVATCKYACMGNSEIHHYKNGLAFLEEMGKKWNICDVLCELSSSPKLEDLGREDLISAEKLLLVLLQRIAKIKACRSS